MESHFHEKLDELRIKVLEMAAYAEKALDKAIKAMIERDSSLAQEVIDEDETINKLECAIDDDSLNILALHQPVARDIRTVVGCMRMIVNLERIGDEAVNIAERALMLNNRPPLPFKPQLEDMAEVTMEMVRSAIKAFKDDDAEMAQMVCDMDVKVNELDLGMIKRLIDFMLKESPAIERSVHTILASRSLERVADLSTNVGESVIFIIKGVDIKHRCGRI